MSKYKNKILKTGTILTLILTIFLIAEKSQSKIVSPTTMIKTVSDDLLKNLSEKAPDNAVVD